MGVSYGWVAIPGAMVPGEAIPGNPETFILDELDLLNSSEISDNLDLSLTLTRESTDITSVEDATSLNQNIALSVDTLVGTTDVQYFEQHSVLGTFDNESISDVSSITSSMTNDLGDTTGTLDTLSVNLVLGFTEGEDVSVAEALDVALTGREGRVDPIPLEDALNVSVGQAEGFSGLTWLSDTVGFAGEGQESWQDTLAIQGTPVNLASEFVESLQNSLGVSDGLGIQQTQEISLVDTASTSDSLALVLGRALEIGDPSTLSDVVDFLQESQVSHEETTAIIDVVTITTDIQKDFPDSIDTQDTFQVSGIDREEFSESVGLSDTLDLLLIPVALIDDELTVIDTHTITSTSQVPYTSTLDISDSLVFQQGSWGLYQDLSGVSDDVVVALLHPVNFTEGVEILEELDEFFKDERVSFSDAYLLDNYWKAELAPGSWSTALVNTGWSATVRASFWSATLARNYWSAILERD